MMSSRSMSTLSRSGYYMNTEPESVPYLSKNNLVAPLVQILGLTIHDKDIHNLRRPQSVRSKSRACYLRGVYGKATVIDRGDSSFDVFNRSKNSPQSIDDDSSDLLLTSPDATVIFPSKQTELVFDLHHTSTKRIAKGHISLVRTAEKDWEPEYRHKRLPGGNDTLYATLHYALYPYAVAAIVTVLYFSKDHNFDSLGYDDGVTYHQHSPFYEKNVAELYGTVSSSCVDFNHHSSLLFRKPIGDSQEVQSGGFIELSRSLVAVPAYSSLQINVSFNDGNTRLPIASGTVAFKAKHKDKYKEDIVGDNGARIRVRVFWIGAHDQLYSVGRHKRGQVQNIKSILTSNYSPTPTVEVFSVVICSKDGEPFNIYGYVNLRNARQDCMWRIDNSCPQNCPTSGMIATVHGPHTCSFHLLDPVVIILKLKDVNDAIFISGLIDFSTLNVHAHENKHFCGVVDGPLGFGAVYFALMCDGVSAQVSVKVTYRGNSSVVVKGRIYARHGTRELLHPPLARDETLFKSLLFCDGGVVLDGDSSGSTLLPLVKSMVFLPRNSFLIIEADLLVSPEQGDSQGIVSLRGTESFFNNDDGCKRIGEGDLYMDVAVEFDEL